MTNSISAENLLSNDIDKLCQQNVFNVDGSNTESIAISEQICCQFVNLPQAIYWVYILFSLTIAISTIFLT